MALVFVISLQNIGNQGEIEMKEYEFTVTLKVIAPDVFHANKQVTEFLRQVYRDTAPQYNIIDYEHICP